VKRWRPALLLLLAAALVAAAASAAETDGLPRTPAEHRRGPEQTFLTFPEWYLVHSPAELAQFLALQRAPSAFPWGGHVGQFWQGYRAVTQQTGQYPFNAGYHLMVSVIGVSTTVEYGLRSAYESTVGRLSEATSDGLVTAEDQLAARVAKAYVDFIRVDPWYLFDFIAPLRELWRDTPVFGGNLLRKGERRFALTTEYLVKAGYAWLIKLGTQSVYDAAEPTTAVVLDRTPSALPKALPGMRRLDAAPADTVLVTVPRYRAFMSYAQALADQGLAFREIAGNRGVIVASTIERSDAPRPAPPLRQIFVQPILTQRGWERRVVAVPVTELAAQLRRWKASSVQLEHLYDY
jgi:hypothetical protein